MKVFPLNLECMIPCGKYNTYQHTSKSSNEKDTIALEIPKLKNQSVVGKMGCEEGRKEREKEETLEEKELLLVIGSQIQIWNQHTIIL